MKIVKVVVDKMPPSAAFCPKSEYRTLENDGKSVRVIWCQITGGVINADMFDAVFYRCPNCPLEEVQE